MGHYIPVQVVLVCEEDFARLGNMPDLYAKGWLESPNGGSIGRQMGGPSSSAHLLIFILDLRYGQELHRLALEENLGAWVSDMAGPGSRK